MEASHIPHGMCGLKLMSLAMKVRGYLSHPSRDVWIEILNASTSLAFLFVTSLTGCVDWNYIGSLDFAETSGHIPHGMCGLKYNLSLKK